MRPARPHRTLPSFALSLLLCSLSTLAIGMGPLTTQARAQAGDASENAAFARELFAGAKGAGRNAVMMETAKALRACGIAVDFLDGARRAREAIDSGAATRKLADLVAMSHGG